LVKSIENDFYNYNKKHGELPALYTYTRWKSLIEGYSSEEWSKEAGPAIERKSN